MAVVGDTIRLTCTFKTFSGMSYDPTDIKLRVYDAQKVIIGEPISMTESNKVSAGVYYYDYTIPEGTTPIYCEFIGQLEGSPIVARKKIERVYLTD